MIKYLYISRIEVSMKRVLKDNKGYMLVEIIIASVISFVMVYFLMDITINQELIKSF